MPRRYPKTVFSYTKGRKSVAMLKAKEQKKEIKKIVKSTVHKMEEMKACAMVNSVAGTAIVQASTNPNSVCITEISTGNANNQRIGNAVNLRKIDLIGSVNWPLGASVGTVRFIVFWDHGQSGIGATPLTYSEVITQNSAGNEFVGTYATGNKGVGMKGGRVSVIYDKFIKPKNAVNNAATTQGQQEFRIRKSWKSKLIRFASTSGVDRLEDHLFFLVVTDLAAGAQPSLRLEGRVYFQDP